MNTELLNIINNSDEPVYELDSYITKLDNKNKKTSVWNYLQEIALTGLIQQRFIVLTVISVNKPSYIEKLSMTLINDRDFRKNEPILKPIINICSNIAQKEHISYLIEVLNYATENNKEYLYELTLRNILITDSWEKIVKEITKLVSKADDLTIIDLMAFFQNRQGVKNYENLISHFDTKTQKKIKHLNKKIKKRLKENYLRIR